LCSAFRVCYRICSLA